MNLSLNDQRPVTLVFATDRTEEAVKEALFDGRTAVYSGDMLIGREEFLKPLFYHSIEVVNGDQDFSSDGTFYIQIKNRSEIPFHLISNGKPEGVEYPEEITMHAERTVMMPVKLSRNAPNNTHGVILLYEVKNLLINKDTGLVVELVIQ